MRIAGRDDRGDVDAGRIAAAALAQILDHLPDAAPGVVDIVHDQQRVLGIQVPDQVAEAVHPDLFAGESMPL
ncbi:MAG: hypothetical protein U1F35_22710 [Steroidobacteraceae bacterium]